MPVCYAHQTERRTLLLQTLLKELRQVRAEYKNRMILGSVNLIQTCVNLRELNVESISARHQSHMRRHCRLDTCFISE